MMPLEVHGRGSHAANDLRLGARDVLAAAQQADVRGADFSDDAVGGLGAARQALDLAQRVHAHLKHHDLGVARSGQNGEGHADEAVVVAARGVDAVARREQGAQHVLCGGLANGAGDTYHGAAHARSITLRQAQEELGGVVRGEDGALVIVRLPYQLARRLAGQNDARRTRLDRLGSVVVAIDALAREGDKDGIGLHLT